jgi:hypothetical protein
MGSLPSERFPVTVIDKAVDVRTVADDILISGNGQTSRKPSMIMRESLRSY